MPRAAGSPEQELRLETGLALGELNAPRAAGSPEQELRPERVGRLGEPERGIPEPQVHQNRN